jgi:hypothetical protein
MKVLIGADPEIFVMNSQGFTSAFNLVPGTKEKPHPVTNGAIQVDGMALEFNIDPAKSRAEFIQYINSVMTQLNNRIPKGLHLEVVATADFTKKYLDSLPTIATELGCSPDFNAYAGGMANPSPDESVTFRTAAGHLHFGWDDDISQDEYHKADCVAIVQLADLLLGVPSVLLDNDTRRRSLYGQAGAYRPKTYGLEYRTLSNFWLKSDELQGWAYDNSQLVFEKLTDIELNQELRNKIQVCIDMSEKAIAKELIKYFKIPMPK